MSETVQIEAAAKRRTRIIATLTDSVMFEVCQHCDRDCGHAFFGDASDIAGVVLAVVGLVPSTDEAIFLRSDVAALVEYWLASWEREVNHTPTTTTGRLHDASLAVTPEVLERLAAVSAQREAGSESSNRD